MSVTKTIEVRVGRTAFGTVERKVNESKTHTVVINGERVPVQDPHGACYVYVLRLPRDIDGRGYGAAAFSEAVDMRRYRKGK